MGRVSRLVEQTLRDYPYTRNSDKELTLHVWEELGLCLTPYQRSKYRAIASTETIRRCRQLIQASGKYRASDEISKQRRLKALIIQQNEPTASVEATEQLIQERIF